MNKKKPIIGGLCSGVGGIELGFKQAGFNIAWANDMDANAMKTYESIMGENHYVNNQPMKLQDIVKNRKVSPLLTKVDVLVAGFPCQAFSIAGYRKGFDDERGNVFFEIVKVIEFLKRNRGAPKVLFLENVKNFKTHDDGKTYATVKETLENLNYSVYTKIINTSKFTGIPQNRERSFMVCFYGEKKWKDYQLDENNETLFNKYELLKAKKLCPSTYMYHELFNKVKQPKKQKIWDYLKKAKEVDDKYFYTRKKYPIAFSLLNETVIKRNTIYQYRRVLVRENKSRECPTLTANMGTGGHNVPIILVNKKRKRYRKLTPEECFLFQGFGNDIQLPIDMADGQLYKLVGNSVTVPLIYKLASIIKSVMVC